MKRRPRSPAPLRDGAPGGSTSSRKIENWEAGWLVLREFLSSPRSWRDLQRWGRRHEYSSSKLINILAWAEHRRLALALARPRSATDEGGEEDTDEAGDVSPAASNVRWVALSVGADGRCKLSWPEL